MRSLFVLIFGLLTITSAFANPSKISGLGLNSSLYKYSAMDIFLKSLKNLEALPSRDTEASHIEAGSEFLPPETLNVFHRIQNSVFKKSLIDLKQCADCFALADYAAKSVYVQPSYVNSLILSYGKSEAQLLVEFMVAHELSHFVHELSIGQGSEPNLSINGNKSLFVHDNENNSADAGRKSHAEIDAYAFMIMRNLNTSSPLKVVRRWFLDTVEEVKKTGNPEDIEVVLKDFENRSKSAELVIKKLWPN